MIKLISWFVCFFILNMTCLLSGSISEIPKTRISPVLDGELNEPLWDQAAIFTEFRTMKPDYGLSPSEYTEVRLTYDSEMIYVGFRCNDRDPAKIKATISRRDTPVNDDWVAFCIDTFNDELSAYFFMLNPYGIQVDGTLNSDADPDITLDLVWSSIGKLTSEGYCAEIAIPFKSLRFPDSEKLVMGFKVARNISRKSEEVDFPEYQPARGAALAQFQKIAFSGIKSSSVVEIIPATTFSKHYFQDRGYLKSEPATRELSLTAKVGLSSDLMLDATYNPDFSQVETDASQIDVNLRYALYYPEKRPFFMEGQNQLGFSANIEDAPLGAIVHTRNIVDPTFGLKLTGKIARQHNLLIIYAQDKFPGEIAAEASNIDLAHKPTHFAILRYYRPLKNDNYIGGFYTQCALGPHSNQVAGVDSRFRLNSENILEFHGFESCTSENNDKKNRAGHALAALYKHETRRFIFTSGIHDVSADFQTDVGYLRRRNLTTIPVYAQYNIYFQSGWLQKLEPYYWSRQIYDKYSSRWESFNVFSIRSIMPRQTEINVQGWLANEIFANHKFNRNTFRIEASSQFNKNMAIEGEFSLGNLIYYDSNHPLQGHGCHAALSLLFEPFGNFSSGFDLDYSDFYRNDNGNKLYDYLIVRNRTIFQLNRFLFLRGITEYNNYKKRLNFDFLASFTYIPGTVIYFGYGSISEKAEWREENYFPADALHLTSRNFFFKASYLWRL
ncbi:carbohydrate binding family 9 domain-containing protein [candidate division KSB1 bacterium]|nr:carbohydrate binding family 9 domain-containing protein [candidate division KSB1 bacterium]